MTTGPEASVILKAMNLDATIEWYEKVGFTVRGRMPAESPATWCELTRDDLTVQFLAGETPWPDGPALTGTLYVRPASVVATYDEVKDRVPVEWGVEERDWGARELTLRDPNGYYLTFTEQT